MPYALLALVLVPFVGWTLRNAVRLYHDPNIYRED